MAVNPYTGTSRFETKHLSAEINYALRTLKVDELSQPFEAKDDRSKEVYLLVKLKSKTPPHVANIDNDYQRIQEMALEFRKQEAMEKWMKEKVKNTYLRIATEWRGCDFETKEWLQQ